MESFQLSCCCRHQTQTSLAPFWKHVWEHSCIELRNMKPNRALVLLTWVPLNFYAAVVWPVCKRFEWAEYFLSGFLKLQWQKWVEALSSLLHSSLFFTPSPVWSLQTTIFSSLHFSGQTKRGFGVPDRAVLLKPCLSSNI